MDKITGVSNVSDHFYCNLLLFLLFKIHFSSVVVGEQSFRNKPSSDREEDGNIDDDVSDDNVNSEEGNSAFSSSWLPDPKYGESL